MKRRFLSKKTNRIFVFEPFFMHLIKKLIELRRFDFIIIVSAILSLIVRILIPANVYTNAGHDDYLGIELARNLLNGDWLGTWNNRTLLKPAGYSYFLVIAHFIPIEPQILIHIMYLGLATYFIWIVKRIFPVNSASISMMRISFILLAFNPMFFSADFSRIYRSSLNVILVMAIILVVIHFWCLVLGNKNLEVVCIKKLLNNQKKVYVFYSSVIGALYAGLILTRSEAIWILYPILAVVFGFTIYILLKINKETRNKKLGLVALVLVVANISFAVPVQGIKLINHHYYGVSQLENYYSGEFARAFSLWTGVKGSSVSPSYIPIDESKRRIVYAISLTARKLEPLIEAAPNTGWKVPNCLQTSICDEAGPWFPYELRDAVTQAYGISSEVEFQSIFRQIADDIENACSTGKIICQRKGSATGTLNFLDISKRLLVNDLIVFANSLLNMDQAKENMRRDGGSDLAQLEIWNSVVKINRVYIMDDKQLFLVLGDLVAGLREIYSKLFSILALVFIFTLLIPRSITSLSGQVRMMLTFLLAAITLYGLGMGVFHSGANLEANNSFYTQPAAPIFLLMLLLSVHLLIYELKPDSPRLFTNESTSKNIF